MTTPTELLTALARKRNPDPAVRAVFDFAALKAEASARPDCFVQPDSITIEIDPDCTDANVCILAYGEASECCQSWGWSGTIADYMAERVTCSNWT